MPENKSILAKKITRIYLKTYMLIMSIIFTLPIIHMFLINKNVPLFGANILFYEFNLFLSLILLIYTYFTRDENRNWKLFLYYFILSFLLLVLTMLILGSNIYI